MDSSMDQQFASSMDSRPGCFRRRKMLLLGVGAALLTGGVVTGIILGVQHARGNGGAAVVVTTNTTTTTTLASTTTVTTTTGTTSTAVSPGGCIAQDQRRINRKVEYCFCFYAGGCREHFPCLDHEPLKTCQHRHCGVYVLDATQVSASFYDIRGTKDLLTIPAVFFSDISDLKHRCNDGGIATLSMLLADGRRVYAAQKDKGQPQWQCVHMTGNLGVHWLHLHTFVGEIPHERLPNNPPYASCAPTNLDPGSAATQILKPAMAGLSEATVV